jgi:nucleotide-binding universal stress UspA family protein
VSRLGSLSDARIAATDAMPDAPMYRHLLVPVDDSALSGTNAEAAVRLARQLGSRITFFRACADAGSTRAGARLKAADPAAFAESTFGDTHAMLARYAVLADEGGVPYDLVSEASRDVADAICCRRPRSEPHADNAVSQ